MHPSPICIFRRPMRRTSMRRTSIRLVALLAISSSVFAAAGCEQLEGRNNTRKGNRLFKASRFVDAVVAYEQALKQVDSPTIHYNLGLTYTKLARPGSDKPVRIGIKGTEACNVITGTGSEDARVCVKISETEDRRFEDCDDKNVCASSYACKQVTLCTMDPAAIADHATSHFLVWIKAQESDDVIAPKLKAAEDALATARDNGDPKALDRAEKDVDKYRAKDDTRTLMTEQWLSAQQFDKAIGYWKGLLDERPKDTGIMGNLAGIANKAGDWRGSIDWYNRVAGASSDDDSKVAAYQAVGYVAFAKLKSNTLTQAESIEAADRGMAALQKGAALAPKNGRLWGLQGSLFLYRSQAEGASFAWLIDRASGQDLQRVANVLAKEAKKAQEGGASTTPPATTPTQPASPAPKAGG